MEVLYRCWVTTESFKTGLPVNPATADYDFFIVSDDLYQQGLKMGIKGTDGAFGYWETANFPSLIKVQETMTTQLGREVTIRIFSKEGYNAIVKPLPNIIVK